MNRRTTETIEKHRILVAFINSKDTFWIQELYDVLGNRVDRNQSGSDSHINRLLIILKKKELIQCCEIKGTQRQYISLKKITINQDGEIK